MVIHCGRALMRAFGVSFFVLVAASVMAAGQTSPVERSVVSLKPEKQFTSSRRTTGVSENGERSTVKSVISLYADPAQGISSGDLVRRALLSNADLSAARLDIERARARLRQAGLRPNPSIDFEQTAGTFTGSADEREISVGFSLPVELGGKRRRRIDLARAELEAAEAEVADRERRLAAEVRSAAPGLDPISGRITYIAPILNEETRTARVRVEVANPGEHLKVGMFVEVGFMTGADENSAAVELMIPEEAAQRIGDRAVVFRPKEGEPGRFEARDVELGGVVDGYHRVISGLAPGDRIVTKGSFTLKTQLLKGEMREHGH